MRRIDRFRLVCELIGSPILRVINPGTGWPGIVEMRLPDGIATVAMHVAPVGSHSRQPYESRFQNPASRSPVVAPGGAMPLLVGHWRDGQHNLLVVAGGQSRLGRESRFSILFNNRILQEAITHGWSEYTSSANERIYAVHPSLFPIVAYAIFANVDVPASRMSDAALASGLVDEDNAEAEERARRATTTIVRDYKFSQEVKQAYGGCCAMCGLGMDLVVGAHIYPASAPASRDTIRNGLALCQNHHSAFDSHRIWVDPESLSLALHPSFAEAAATDSATKNFVDIMASKLKVPRDISARPSPKMFIKRYAYYSDQYDWALALR